MPQPFRIPPPFDSTPASEPDFHDAGHAFDMGTRALRAGFLDPARAIFQALASHEAASAEVVVEWARTEFMAGRFRLAERILDRLDKSEVDRAAAAILRADCAFSQGNVARGLSLGFFCTESNPADSWSRFFSARMLWMGGDDEAAELAFLSLVGEPEVGSRACAWSVFCGWKQAQFSGEVAALFDSLRRDDVVCEGLREFGADVLGLPWEPSHLVEPLLRSRCALEWSEKFHREFGAIQTKTALVGGLHLI